jgi:hypothetical protein
MATALGPPSKSYLKKNFAPLLDNISDKQTLVRNDVVDAVDKWADAAGAENVMNYVFLKLATENPESRTECFKWINKNIDSISECDTAASVSPLVSCLQDKSKDIR